MAVPSANRRLRSRPHGSGGSPPRPRPAPAERAEIGCLLHPPGARQHRPLRRDRRRTRSSGGKPVIPDPIIIVDYNPTWPDTFRRLGARARAALGDLAIAIEHVGSTAVPGLAAKPVIDLDVVIRSSADLPAAIAGLATFGYVYQGEQGVPDRHAFAWPPDEPRHHLYVCPTNSLELRRHLALRDYLRTHPDAARAYGALKRAAALTHRDDRDAYTQAKDAMVKKLLHRALAGSAQPDP